MDAFRDYVMTLTDDQAAILAELGGGRRPSELVALGMVSVEQLKVLDGIREFRQAVTHARSHPDECDAAMAARQAPRPIAAETDTAPPAEGLPSDPSAAGLEADGAADGDAAAPSGAIRFLEEVGVAALTESARWSVTVRHSIAMQLAELKDPALVEKVMALPAGAVDRLLADPGFRRHFESTRVSRRAPSAPDIDFGRALTPGQRRAARMLVDGRKQVDVAAALRVDRTTVANWRRNEVFTRYVAQLEQARKEEEATARRVREEALVSRELRLYEESIDVIEGALRQGDRKVAIATLARLGKQFGGSGSR